MKPKQLFISILAVLFAFPLMGTFAQQATELRLYRSDHDF